MRWKLRTPQIVSSEIMPGFLTTSGGLVLLHLDQQAIVGLGGPREAVLLAMQGIGGEQHAADPQFGDQRWHGPDLARCPRPPLVGPGEGDVAGKRAEPMRRFPGV